MKKPRDGGTFVTLEHTGVPHIEGWNFVLGCLADMMPKNLKR